MRRRFNMAILSLALLGALGGCGTTGTPPAPAPPPTANQGPNPTGTQPADFTIVAPSPRVDEIHLTSSPAAANWDDDPKPDGVEVICFLTQVDQPTPVSLEHGVVDFIIYPGAVKRADLAGAVPFHVWRLTAAELMRFRRKGLIGWEYGLGLSWGNQVPKSNLITVTARVVYPDRAAVYADPTIVALSNK